MHFSFSPDFSSEYKFEGGLQKVATRYLRIFLPLELGIVSVASLYTLLTNGNQVVVIYTSTGIAIATFTAILLYHALQKIRGFRCCDNQYTQYTLLITNSATPSAISTLNPNQDDSDKDEYENWPPVKQFNHLREPLLEHAPEIAHPQH